MNKKVKLGLKVAGGALAWLPVSTLVLAQIDVPTVLNSNAPVNNTYFRDLIKEKPELAEKEITNIAMLASHDSLSDDIYMMSKMDPHSPNNNQLAQIAEYVGQGAMVRLSRAQSDNIYTQLNAGVRYVDARITCVNGNYYTHHTMISNTLEHYLLQILQWLDDNPGEFIFFHIYYFNYEGIKLQDKTSAAFIEARDKAWTDLEKYIRSVKYKSNRDGIERSLLDYDTTDAPIGELTYNDVTNDGKDPGAVVYFSSDDTKEGKAGEWYTKHMYYEEGENVSKHIYNPCALRMDSNAVVDKIKNTYMPEVGKMDETTKTQTLRYIQTQTTPNVDDAGKILTSWSLIQKAHDHNDFILNHSGLNFAYPKDMDCVFKYFPIYMCDYTTCNDNGFCQKLINYMIAYNKTL